MKETRDETFVLAVDPGKSVGWSYGRGRRLLTYGIVKIDLSALFVFLSMEFGESFSRLVIERFDLRHLDNDAMYTVEMIGALKLFAHQQNRQVDIAFVNTVDKKKFLPKVLRETPLRDHAADAEAIRLYDLAYGIW